MTQVICRRVQRPEQLQHLTPDQETKLLLLQESLGCAVPLWAHQLRDEPWDRLQDRARLCAQVVAEKGDRILYRSTRKGETAEAFNRLAEGIAILSFIPGGIRTLGLEFCFSALRHEHDIPAIVQEWVRIFQDLGRHKP